MIQGLRKYCYKCFKYSKLSTIDQGKGVNPLAFMARLREALTKYASMSPDSFEVQLILKNKFVTQSAPDIRRKP